MDYGAITNALRHGSAAAERIGDAARSIRSTEVEAEYLEVIAVRQ
jgi:hypothetical protein